MTSIRYTRNLFLRGICVVYLFAFLSFYLQIPGLYGNNGILPAKLQLEGAKSKTLSAKIHNKPTLLWLAPYIGLDTEYMMDALALLGSFLAFTGFISQKFCTLPTYAGLWSLYFSLFQVGQMFMWFQWDTLLLEAGVLAVLVAPLMPPTRSRRTKGSKGEVPADTVTMWLVRWLLFRVLFAAGIVKFVSNCPKWWDLTGLSIHFQSMVLPSALAWYCHQLPLWFLKITQVFVHVAEIGLPFLYFAPIRSVRITGFFIQIFLQICIVITGNFSYFNFLNLTLLISLLDDQFFYKKSKKQTPSKLRYVGYLMNILIHGAVIYGTCVLFGIRINGTTLESKISFTRDQFEKIFIKAIPITVYIGAASLGLTVSRAIAISAVETPGAVKKLTTVLTTLVYSAAAALIFTVSTVPIFSLHSSTNTTINPVIRDLYQRIEPYKIVNSHVIFRRMTGVDGRPEVVLEGSNHIEGPWTEFNFIYKPGNVNNSLPYIVPYSPRLDWQMWFAALGTYHQQPWLMSLAYRILHGQTEVLNLIDRAHSPFPNHPPKYLRATLYKYKYTKWSERWQPSWWTREKVGEYFPIFSKDHGPLLDYLRSVKILPDTSKVKNTINPYVKLVFDYLRLAAAQVEGSFFLWSVFTAGVAIIATSGSRK